MPTTPTPRRGTRTPESGAPVVPQDPPPWIARAVAWLLLALFATAVAAVFLVRVPETVEVPFVLKYWGSTPVGVPPLLRAHLTVSVRDGARIPAGARMRLVFDDFPPERYGSVPAQVDTRGGMYVDGSEKLEQTTIGVGSDRRELTVGLKGTARVVVGDRSIAEALFSPRR